MTSTHPTPRHHFTIDVEEYFQVSAFESHVPRDEWTSLPRRLPRQIDVILELLDEVDATATFFTLGWVARHEPHVVRTIADAGHEVASHGWDHRRITQLSPDEFRAQARDSRAILEDVSGTPVNGFRAPSFSIVPGLEWALEILVEEGYLYDSSLYPVRRPGYGYPGGPGCPHRLELAAGHLHELPPTVLEMGSLRLPAAGGGTFRQLPYAFTRSAFRRAEAAGHPGMFYIHPWELDADQPRVEGLPWYVRVRHYRGLSRVGPRIGRLLSDLGFGSVRDVGIPSESSARTLAK